jgi:hypothetical protein
MRRRGLRQGGCNNALLNPCRDFFGLVAASRPTLTSLTPLDPPSRRLSYFLGTRPLFFSVHSIFTVIFIFIFTSLISSPAYTIAMRPA